MCAYVSEYINEIINRGISNLHHELIKMTETFPEKDYEELLKSVSLQMLNSVEICIQEAAWYLLRLNMSEIGRSVEYIPTS